MGKTVLIVDDDPTQRRLLQAVIEKSGFSTLQADNGDTALDMALGADAHNIHVMMLDLVMPGRDGMETLEELQAKRPELPVIVLTGKGSIETVVKAMKMGARDFVVKPASPERIIVSIRNALEMKTLVGEVKRLKKTTNGGLTFDDLIGNAGSMRPVVAMGERGAKANIPILITGESGVGKEVIARAIQGASERSDKPFVTVNCGAIPETLVESILFGHEKGSFTGANAKHLGKFQEAHTGTLFLDEVGELPLDMQVKLLRVGADSDTVELLKNFEWKGNVRQLENTIFRAMILSDGNSLKPHDFPQISGLAPAMPSASDDALSSLVKKAEGVENLAITFLDREGHLRTLEDIERDLIQFAIENYSGHMSEVARRLGIGRSTLYRKVREHELDVDAAKSA